MLIPSLFYSVFCENFKIQVVFWFIGWQKNQNKRKEKKKTKNKNKQKKKEVFFLIGRRKSKTFLIEFDYFVLFGKDLFNN